MSINFGSTFEVSLQKKNQPAVHRKQAGKNGINKNDMIEARKLAKQYGGEGNVDTIRLCCPKGHDDIVAQKLKTHGFLNFKIAPVHDAMKHELATVIQKLGQDAEINKGIIKITKRI